MRTKISNVLPLVGIIGIASMALLAQANTTNFSFSGPGVSGQGTFTYAPVSGGVDNITGITGTFSDSNAGLNGKTSIDNATITGLVAISPLSTLPTNVTAPDFSQFAIAHGVPAQPPATTPSPSLSYDNNYYPAGSPVVCSDYPASGGVFDVYGLMFTLSNGDVVGLWSNGIFPHSTAPADYGVAVADTNYTYDYVNGGVTASVPEPSAWGLVAACAGLGFVRRRRTTKAMPA